MSFTQKVVMVRPWCFSTCPKICLGILWHNFYYYCTLIVAMATALLESIRIFGVFQNTKYSISDITNWFFIILFLKMKLVNFMKFIKFLPYLIFSKRETTENKRFLPKILLRTKIFKSSLFRDTLYCKICDVTKMVIFNNIFCTKVFIYSYSTYM